MVAERNKVHSNSSIRQERGFTLVELLMAIFIFAIVISSVYGAYRATFHVIHGSESRLQTANAARIVFEILTEDLGSLVTGPGGVFRGETNDYSGNRGDSLSFISSAHLVLRKADTHAGPVLLRYEVEPDAETGLLNLYRLQSALLPGVEPDDADAARHLVCRGLQEFRFTYLDRDGKETEEWLLDERGASGEGVAQEEPPFPAQVSVELRFAESVESESSTLFKTAVALQ
ncbi:PulJ/GspJ family protein [Desulfocastanea catecholica]